MIKSFNVKAYLNANQDIKLSLNNAELKDITTHVKKTGLKDIEKGLRKFHDMFEPFDEEYYLKLRPDVKAAVEKKAFRTGFDHFCQYGSCEKQQFSGFLHS